MTSQKLTGLFTLYRERVVERFGPLDPARNPAYSGRGHGADDAQTLKHDVAHLYWMLDEGQTLVDTHRVPKAMRWLGFVQHAMLTFGLVTLAEIKEHSKNHDETAFPPPPGLTTVQAKIVVVFRVNDIPVTILVRQSWLPAGVVPHTLRFPDFDPEGRLHVIQDLGIRIDFDVIVTEWSYADLSLSVILSPVDLSEDLSEESVALAVGFLRQAGWDYKDDNAKAWPARWAAVRRGEYGHDPDCPHHPANTGLELWPSEPGDAHGDPTSAQTFPKPKPKPRKRPKRRRRAENEDDGENEAGRPGQKDDTDG